MASRSVSSPSVKSPKATSELPLHALRVFASCAQTLSFTKAAEHLQVTQAAVSHQIKLLEEHLGVRLFVRSGRGVVLTVDGAVYVAAVRESLTHLDFATQKIRRGGKDGITCTVANTIAMRWLMPRLAAFSLQYPDTRVHLDLTERYVDLAAEDVDLAIRYGEGRWPGLVADLLFREMLVPVCSPALMESRHRSAGLKDLRQHTLLHASAALQDWTQWLHAHGAKDIDATRGLVFEQPHLALQAAIDGLGIAMADRALAQRELDSGHLCIPFGGGLIRRQGYYVVGVPGVREGLRTGRFWRWLMAQALEPNGGELTRPAAAA